MPPMYHDTMADVNTPRYLRLGQTHIAGSGRLEAATRCLMPQPLAAMFDFGGLFAPTVYLPSLGGPGASRHVSAALHALVRARVAQDIRRLAAKNPAANK